MSERIKRRWTGPLAEVRDLPEVHLHRVRITVRHDAGKERETAMTKALSRVMGKARIIHYAGVRRAVSWDKTRWHVLGTAGRRSMRLRARELKPSQLRALVDATAEVPGACDLRLQGRS